MKRIAILGLVFISGFTAAWLAASPAHLTAGDRKPGERIPAEIYLELTREFYEALRQGHPEGATVYTSDPSTQYLREIAVAARFMVESNLQILREQAKITRLLEKRRN